MPVFSLSLFLSLFLVIILTNMPDMHITVALGFFTIPFFGGYQQDSSGTGYDQRSGISGPAG
ncbi:MAG: hypothetical protein WDO71_28665 [Bacteroidota bacterium]